MDAELIIYYTIPIMKFEIKMFLQGIVVNGVIVIVTAWCVRMRGPTYVSAFNPLALVVVALACSLMFDENLHVGRYVN